MVVPLALPPGMGMVFWGFGSAHPGGINFVFCDGSVQSISYEIDRELYVALGNKSDGLMIDGNQF